MKLIIVQLNSPVTSSLLDPNSLLITLFSNTLSLCSSLTLRGQHSHPYKNWQDCGFVYLNLYIPGQHTGRKKTLTWTAESISRI
jgi:hypothetical protein